MPKSAISFCQFFGLAVPLKLLGFWNFILRSVVQAMFVANKETLTSGDNWLEVEPE